MFLVLPSLLARVHIYRKFSRKIKEAPQVSLHVLNHNNRLGRVVPKGTFLTIV